jgi:A/G-specific adenine glycosylase
MNAAGAILLERRPPTGIWGGLWTFPQFDDEDAAEEAVSGWRIADSSQKPALPARRLPAYHHSFTHYDLTLHPLLIHVVGSQPGISDTDRYVWYDPRQPARIGLAKPAVELIRSVTGQTQSSGDPQRDLL